MSNLSSPKMFKQRINRKDKKSNEDVVGNIIYKQEKF